MIPVGYMAKRISPIAPAWLAAPAVLDVYSVSDCVSADVLESDRLEQNGYGLFNSPEVIRVKAAEKSIDLKGTTLFYYEAYEAEFDGEEWSTIATDPSYETHVEVPSNKQLEGFDIVSDCDGPNSHSPLSCNAIAADILTNQHCLFATQEEAINSLNHQVFEDGEPGPYKVYAVYTVTW